MPFLLTQFADGTESCVHVVELALAVNEEMERRGKERYQILVPWLYGDRQRLTLLKAFRSQELQHPSEILLDEGLGRILLRFLDNEAGYAVKVVMWVSGWQDAGRAVRAHFDQDITVSNLAGEAVPVGRANIALELNSSPRFHFGLSISYQATHCRLTQLFKAVEAARARPFPIGRDLLFSAQKVAAEIERNIRRTYVSVPGTFTWPDSESTSSHDSELVPPFVALPPLDSTLIPPSSVYVTVPDNGEPDKSLRSVLTWGVPVFTNDPERLGGGFRESQNCLRNPNIRFHVACGEWKAVALSYLNQKPLLVPPYSPSQDPEIYFNIESALKQGVAHPFREEPLERRQAQLDALQPNLKMMNEKVRQNFGTLDGQAVVARKIVDDLLREPRPAY